MKINEEDFGGSMGDVFDLFNKLETEEDYKLFYKEYIKFVDNSVCKKEGLKWGDKKPYGKIIDIAHANLHYLLSRNREISDMRSDFARKVWWFL